MPERRAYWCDRCEPTPVRVFLEKGQKIPDCKHGTLKLPLVGGRHFGAVCGPLRVRVKIFFGAWRERC